MRTWGRAGSRQKPPLSQAHSQRYLLPLPRLHLKATSLGQGTVSSPMTGTKMGVLALLRAAACRGEETLQWNADLCWPKLLALSLPMPGHGMALLKITGIPRAQLLGFLGFPRYSTCFPTASFEHLYKRDVCGCAHPHKGWNFWLRWLVLPSGLSVKGTAAAFVAQGLSWRWLLRLEHEWNDSLEQCMA